MNQHKLRLASLAAGTVMVTALYSTFTFAAASPAATAGDAQARVEMRINNLHAKLRITPQEEDQWAQVAGVMRDNAKTMDALNSERAANANTMTAVDDLKSYGEITDAHADEIKKFAAAFEPLYASMSDAQKADADEIFRHGVKAGTQKLAQKK